MIRLLMLYFYILFGSFLIVQKAAGQAFRTKIFYDGRVNEAVEDLKGVLKPYNAGNIRITQAPLGDRTGQEFFLSSGPAETLMQYTTQNSLENAVYTYLDMLGFRWYGPCEHWFIRPDAITIPIIKGTWFKPTFRNRYFFGTGGLDFGVRQAYDPQNQYKKEWYDWKRRNRFNADFPISGHSGQAFYQENKNLLDANPSWFSSESGKENGRIKIDNSAAVNAYKSWIRRKYKTARTEFVILGVDPEDGRGGKDDPLPSPKTGIKNHADKWWWLANEVAKDYNEDDRKVVVSMYAYGDGPYNALVPSFKLRRNVYPVIIPYAFQTAYLPEEMIRTWASKVQGNMGIYDYWNITEWSKGVPQFNIYTISQKLRLWLQNKINGVYIETTDAAGPMGHSLWLAGQLQWDLGKNFESLYNQYLQDCFGNAAPPVRKMFDRWSTGYQGAGDVAMSLNDLKTASSLISAKSPERKRLADLKAYVHFLKLFYEHDGSVSSRERIFRYLYSIHHLMLVQTAAFVGQGYIVPGGPAPTTGYVKPLSYDDIEQQFKKDLNESPLQYAVTDFSFDFNRVQYSEPIDPLAWRFGGYQCHFFFTAPFTGKLVFDAGAEGNSSLKVYTDDKKLIDETVGTENHDYREILTSRTWSMKKLSVPVEKVKVYHIQTSYGFSRVKINTPGIVLFKNPGTEDFDNYAYPVHYFYVPQSVSEIIFFDAEPEAFGGRGYLITPDGQKMKRENTGMKNIYRVPVSATYKGKLWKADFGHTSWYFKNIPNIAAIQPFAYKE